ncbi:uncharacterized protein LOC105691458 [Athalia rosae]|uniref:uncharacterized protein LOC105691458 n=1 Tax=Athalia rosae TaxID=37344 RepID=UPI002033839A|nr:uncharacterized protein LOC105691458 [Athalia rosae]
MSRLDPEEVCCGFTENPKTAKPKSLKEDHAAKKSTSDKISQRNRIEQLKIQMARLAHDISEIKNQHSRSSALIQEVVERGMRSLGDRFIVDCSADENLGRSSGTSCCSESSNGNSSEAAEKKQKSKKACSEFTLG